MIYDLWNLGRETGRKGYGQPRKGNFAMIGGVSIWILACSSSNFLKVFKICNRLICNMIQYGNLHVHYLERSQEGYASLKGVFYGFWAQGSYVFLKINKTCNRLIYNMVIFRKPHFFTQWRALGGYFAPRVFQLVSSISFLYFST